MARWLILLLLAFAPRLAQAASIGPLERSDVPAPGIVISNGPNATGAPLGTLTPPGCWTLSGTTLSDTCGSSASDILGALGYTPLSTAGGTVTGPTAFTGGLTGTLTGGASLDLPLAGGTMTGAMVNTAGGTAISVPNGSVSVGGSVSVNPTGTGTLTVGAPGTYSTVNIGSAVLQYSSGLGAVTLTGAPNFVAATLETTSALGLLLGAPSNNAIITIGNQGIALGNITNGTLFYIASDLSSVQDVDQGYFTANKAGSDWSKFSTITGVDPRDDMWLDCSAELVGGTGSVGEPCYTKFGQGTAGVGLVVGTQETASIFPYVYGATLGNSAGLMVAQPGIQGGSAVPGSFDIAPTGGGAVTMGAAQLVPSSSGLSVNVAAYTDASTPTIVTGGTAFNYIPGVFGPGGAGMGDLLYGPGNIKQGLYAVTATQFYNPVVVSGGTGGAPGACTVTGTTGQGTKFTASGTVNSSGGLSGALTIVSGGAYAINPGPIPVQGVHNIAAEPVSGCGLSGATVSGNMGVEAVQTLIPDENSTALAGTYPLTGGSGTGATAAFSSTLADTLALQSGTGIATYHGVPLAPSATTDTTNAANITSGTLPATRLPASGVTAGSCGSSTTSCQITVNAAGSVTALSSTTISGGGGSAAIFSPQGRLTLTSGSPVMTADVVGATTIYYDDMSGNAVPVFNGTSSSMLAISGGEISLALNATDEPSGALYDVFAINAGGVATLCAGPAWAELQPTPAQRTAMVEIATTGYYTNTSSLAHCYAGATDEGPIAANEGAYLGTFETSAAGAVTMQFQPAAAAGGANCMLGLFNAYNQQPVSCLNLDNTSGWSYAAAAWRAVDGSAANRVNFVEGLPVSEIKATLESVANISGATCANGIDLNSTSATPQSFLYASTGGLAAMTNVAAFPPILGASYVAGVEYAFSSGCGWQAGGAGSTRSALLVWLEM